MRTVTSVEAQNRFGELIDSAQREPVTITLRGRPVAFVLSPEDMRALLAVRAQRERVVSDFEAFFRSADARLKSEALELSDRDVQRMVNELRKTDRLRLRQAGAPAQRGHNATVAKRRTARCKDDRRDSCGAYGHSSPQLQENHCAECGDCRTYSPVPGSPGTSSRRRARSCAPPVLSPTVRRDEERTEEPPVAFTEGKTRS